MEIDWDNKSFDRVGVGRLMVWIKQHIRDVMNMYVFEPNDNITRAHVKYDIEQFLGNIVDRKGLEDYMVVCDETNNPPDAVDQDELHVDIAVRPIKSLEFVYIPAIISHYKPKVIPSLSEHEIKFERAMKGI